ncbi:tRNA pseudouridine(55) synthase TruB [Actinomyces gaoshouyii]|uniref:tRNA pseudouridine(55) synthase TruB n=1 Tax=Actinomyces gaoshouyii TaxID=1960083 RepID=UPI0009C195C5|nr:tRNA pseudouridine(55) synthase TruB [Actinomyces gaoshouyii]ARD41913.1 tRNA pseudouridine(55) synthase TruB [Actinomyces gaoshouyii]
MNRPRVARGAVTADDGLLLIDKPVGVTSHDVVAAARRMGATRKVGHAGTLDPMATGLLILGVGRATRFLTHLVGADKTYEATVRLGQETLTEDAEGEPTAWRGCPAPAGEARETDLNGRLDAVLAGLTGPIMQVPSAVSAIKVNGVRSYKRVRDGEEVALAARPVTIHSITPLGALRPGTVTGRAGQEVPVVDLDLRVSCSSGTYIRALARDLGEALGCGAHLTALRRTRVGPFDAAEALSLDQAGAQVEAGAGDDPPSGLRTLPLAEAGRRCFPAVELGRDEARAIRYGRGLPAAVLDRAGPAPERPVVAKAAKAAGDEYDEGRGIVAGFDPDGVLVALLIRKGGRARPALVLSSA